MTLNVCGLMFLHCQLHILLGVLGEGQIVASHVTCLEGVSITIEASIVALVEVTEEGEVGGRAVAMITSEQGDKTQAVHHRCMWMILLIWRKRDRQ